MIWIWIYEWLYTYSSSTSKFLAYLLASTLDILMCEWALHEAGNWQLNSKVKVGAFTPSMRHFCYRLMPRASTQNRTLPPASQWLQRSRWPLAERSQLMGFSLPCFRLNVQHDLIVFFPQDDEPDMPTKDWKKNIKSCEINLDLGDNMPISTDVQFVPMVCFRHSKTHSREAFCWLRWIHISVFGFRFQHFVWSDASYFWWRSDKKGTIVPSTEKFLSPT